MWHLSNTISIIIIGHQLILTTLSQKHSFFLWHLLKSTFALHPWIPSRTWWIFPNIVAHYINLVFAFSEWTPSTRRMGRRPLLDPQVPRRGTTGSRAVMVEPDWATLTPKRSMMYVHSPVLALTHLHPPSAITGFRSVCVSWPNWTFLSPLFISSP